MIDQEKVATVLRAMAAVDADNAPKRHSKQTDDCPSIARFCRVAKFGDEWTAEESNHILGCAFCTKTQASFLAAIEEDKCETT